MSTFFTNHGFVAEGSDAGISLTEARRRGVDGGYTRGERGRSGEGAENARVEALEGVVDGDGSGKMEQRLT